MCMLDVVRHSDLETLSLKESDINYRYKIFEKYIKTFQCSLKQ